MPVFPNRMYSIISLEFAMKLQNARQQVDVNGHFIHFYEETYEAVSKLNQNSKGKNIIAIPPKLFQLLLLFKLIMVYLFFHR